LPLGVAEHIAASVEINGVKRPGAWKDLEVAQSRPNSPRIFGTRFLSSAQTVIEYTKNIRTMAKP